jgi:predicted nucleotidyltransferase
MVTRTSRLFEGLASPAIVSAYVFGSCAEGRTHRESDLDTGVVMDYCPVPTPAIASKRRFA